jgi:hypothetical protein
VSLANCESLEVYLGRTEVRAARVTSDRYKTHGPPPGSIGARVSDEGAADKYNISSVYKYYPPPE